MIVPDVWQWRADAVGGTARLLVSTWPSKRAGRLALPSALTGDWLRLRSSAETCQSTATQTVLLHGQLRRVCLSRPLAVTVERDADGWFVIGDREFNVYGHGRTEMAAIRDYGDALGEFCELVAASTRTEDRSLKAKLRRLATLKR